jgi:hypothetical protein
MKKKAQLRGAFSAFQPISPKSASKQHEALQSASKKKQVPHYASRGAAPVL